jgi:hypothetical protein
MSTPPLSFERASYADDPAGPDQCAYCQRAIAGEYFPVSGNLACPGCAERAQSLIPPNSHGAFVRALSYGAAAAVLGCIGYALLVIWTGWTIGYAAIGVGFMIGWAMKRGAAGNGGRRYQVAAALLTYMAVAMAFIPIALHEPDEAKKPDARQTANAGGGGGAQGGAQSGKPAKTNGAGGFFLAVGELIGLGLVAPFAVLAGSFGSGLLNLFIIFIGVRYAWNSMAPPRVQVEGPYAGDAVA